MNTTFTGSDCGRLLFLDVGSDIKFTGADDESNVCWSLARHTNVAVHTATTNMKSRLSYFEKQRSYDGGDRIKKQTRTERGGNPTLVAAGKLILNAMTS